MSNLKPIYHAGRKLWHFHGGLHLPDNKAMSMQQPLQDAALPDQLVIPLQQHIGELPKLLIKVGATVAKGQLLAEAQRYVSANVHAPTSGTVVEITPHVIIHPSGLKSTCIILQTDGEDRWADHLPAPMTPFRDYSTAELGARIRWAGIVGLGGATFPSSIKLNLGPERKVETLVVNGAECEPYISCDDTLMQTEPKSIIQGIEIVMHMLSAKNCLIGIEDNKPQAIASMQQAAAENGNPAIEVVVIPTLYPSGGERQLIQILTGREVPSRGLPADISIVCHNVGTLAAINDAVLLGRPLISRIVTVTGQGVHKPGNYRVRIGTPISALVNEAGGYNEHAKRLILGGPMMGHTLDSDDIPLTKGANCVLVNTAEEIEHNSPAVPCIRCGKCAEACPVGLLPQQLYWHARSRDLDKTQDYNLFDCIECGCCSHVCPSHIPLVQYYRYAKTEIWAKEEERKKSDIARQRHEFKQARLERIEAEKKARLRKKKEDLETPAAVDQDPKKAAIAAAMKRAAEKKKQLQEAGLAPANTDNLSDAQQKQIEAADKRRGE
jgi:electron transport complex protein RnfC